MRGEQFAEARRSSGAPCARRRRRSPSPPRHGRRPWPRSPGGGRGSRAHARSRPRRGTGARRQQLGEGEIEPLSARGPVPIDAQKHVPPGLAAVDGDQEDAFSALPRSRARRNGPRGTRGPGSRSHGGRTSGRRGARADGPAAAPPRSGRAAVLGSGPPEPHGEGSSSCFHECGPTAQPNTASSSRRSTRYVAASWCAVQPCGSSSAEEISSSTIAPSLTVGPTTR